MNDVDESKVLDFLLTAQKCLIRSRKEAIGRDYYTNQEVFVLKVIKDFCEEFLECMRIQNVYHSTNSLDVLDDKDII